MYRFFTMGKTLYKVCEASGQTWRLATWDDRWVLVDEPIGLGKE